MGKGLAPSAILRLEVESMRHQIVHSVMLNQDDLEAEINRCVTQAIKEFDFQGVIMGIVNDTLLSAIRTAVERDVVRAANGAWREMRDLVMGKLLKEELAGGE